MNNDKQLIAWLNDAYGMERSLAKVLENHVKDSEEYPELRTRLEQHLVETRRHADQVALCLERLGEKPSTTKAVIGSTMGAVQGAASGMFRDEIIKNLLSDYSAENMEIASYKSLVAAADELGHPEIARTCEGILRDEEEMADWLEQKIPMMTRTFLQRCVAAV
ncbi:MAG: ferritin-like domain-containing protein [Opitutaceae bacterium]|nr:ferritin-like domain-containing protein [Opitutaceae bacterium]